MERETHADLIARFIFMLPLYFLGMCVTFMIFFLMGYLEAFVRENLTWNIVYGTPMASETKYAIENFVWIIANFMLVGANIALLWIAAKILGVFKSRNDAAKLSKHSIGMKYQIIYVFLGLVIGLGATGLIGLCYFFIGGFVGLKFMNISMAWSDGFMIFIMPILLALGSIILFIVAGIKGGKRLCRNSLIKD